MSRIVPSRLLAVAVVAAAACLVALPVAAEDQCDATLSPSLESENEEGSYTEYVFKVDVSSPAICARISWVLKTVETRANNEDVEKTTPYVTEVRDGMTTAAAKHRISSDETLVSWDVEKTGCTPCGAEKSD
jgi:hypothetical protein